MIPVDGIECLLVQTHVRLGVEEYQSLRLINQHNWFHQELPPLYMHLYY